MIPQEKDAIQNQLEESVIPKKSWCLSTPAAIHPFGQSTSAGLGFGVEGGHWPPVGEAQLQEVAGGRVQPVGDSGPHLASTWGRDAGGKGRGVGGSVHTARREIQLQIPDVHLTLIKQLINNNKIKQTTNNMYEKKEGRKEGNTIGK